MAMICKSGGRECDGCMSCYAENPLCPICSNETDTYYYNRHSGDIVGCGECLSTTDAWESVSA